MNYEFCQKAYILSSRMSTSLLSIELRFRGIRRQWCCRKQSISSLNQGQHRRWAFVLSLVICTHRSVPLPSARFSQTGPTRWTSSSLNQVNTLFQSTILALWTWFSKEYPPIPFSMLTQTHNPSTRISASWSRKASKRPKLLPSLEKLPHHSNPSISMTWLRQGLLCQKPSPDRVNHTVSFLPEYVPWVGIPRKRDPQQTYLTQVVDEGVCNLEEAIWQYYQARSSSSHRGPRPKDSGWIGPAIPTGGWNR